MMSASTAQRQVNGHVVPDEKPLAIIGLAARVAQEATTAERFWEFLLRARQSTTRFPKDRLNQDAYYHPDPDHGGTFHVKGASFLSEHPAAFDAGFFRISQTELLSLDPQQRLVMENVYHALENAGIPMEKAVSSSTAVFVTGFNVDQHSTAAIDSEISFKHRPTGDCNSLLSNRVSWFYDFRGPSMTVDTACSGSMVALHLAAQSLKSGESEMAVVSGVSIINHVHDMIGMSYSGFLGEEGKCFSFDHRAQGYARGEGVGTVILKTLTAALRDGDTIRAVVRGTAVNQDGRTPGITNPNSAAQQALIEGLYRDLHLDPKETMFVEAHGTGTAVGDPVEARAIAKGLRSEGRENLLYIGAVKSGIGHLEGGAAVAGIIKSIHILENGIIPPNVNFEKVNPKIPKEQWKLEFPTEPVPWPSEGLRRISVNSFGFGGTNAHCVLDDAYHFLKERGFQGAHHNTRVSVPSKEQISSLVATIKDSYQEKDESELAENMAHPDEEKANGVVTSGKIPDIENVHHHKSQGLAHHRNGTLGQKEDVPKLFVFSASDKDSLNRYGSVLNQYLKKTPSSEQGNEQEFLANLAYTLSERRSRLSRRTHVLAYSLAELQKGLSDDSFHSRSIASHRSPKLGFVFTGQGAQYHKMGQQLLAYPVYKRSLFDASEYMKNTLGSSWSLMEELAKDKEDSLIHSPALGHAACTALQIALVELLTSWNIFPHRVVGHSSGEIAAAYCAGKISREAAWKTSYFRGCVSSRQTTRRGSMMAVGLNQTKLKSYLEQVHKDYDGELIIACLNSPKNNTVSGDEEMVDRLKGLLDTDQVFARKLHVQNAYHSLHMEEIAEDYLKAMGQLETGNRPNGHDDIEMFSTVTGKKVEDTTLDAQYFVTNMVSTVKFTEGLQTMHSTWTGDPMNEAFIDEIIEIGPHSALRSAIKETIGSISYSSVLNRDSSSIDTLLNTVGTLSSKSYPVNIHAINALGSDVEKHCLPKVLVDLPPYQFDHSSKTIYEGRLSKNVRFRKFPQHQLFGAPVTDWNPQYPRWRHFLRISELPWLRDHMVSGTIIFPGVGFLVMAIEASRQIADPSTTITGFRLKAVSIKRALIIPDTKEGVEVYVSISPARESNVRDSPVWKQFHISSYSPLHESWTEHCTGTISTEYDRLCEPVDNGREHEAERQQWTQILEESTKLCQEPLNTQNIYRDFDEIGLKFGPRFRNLSDVKVNAEGIGAVTATVRSPDMKSILPKGYVQEHLIHPATFDSIAHTGILAMWNLASESTKSKRQILPVFVGEVWVSAKLTSRAQTTLHAYGKAAPDNIDSYHYQVRCWDATTGEPRLLCSNLRAALTQENKGSQQLCYGLSWVPDVHMLETRGFRSMLEDEQSKQENGLRDEETLVKQCQLAAVLLIYDALRELSDFDFSTLEGHLLRYYVWMNHIVLALITNTVRHVSLGTCLEYSKDNSRKEELYNIVSSSSRNGALLLRMGRSIPAILRNEIDPLYLMFGQDDLMRQVYDEDISVGHLPASLKKYVSIITENCTNLRVLEIGAGTGGFTNVFLQSICPKPSDKERRSDDSISPISEYVFTDISTGFYSKAKKRLQKWTDLLSFEKLDISQDPVTQGFSLQQYDLVIASNVLHATPDLKQTLQYTRSLLKPGGKLLFHEGTPDFVHVSLIFGQLPGWWLGSESYRMQNAYITHQQWDIVLRESGFSGVDIHMPSLPDPEVSRLSIMVSTSVHQKEEIEDIQISSSSDKILIICSQADVQGSVMSTVANALLEIFGSRNCSLVRPSELEDKEIKASPVCLSLLELETPLLKDLKEEDFQLVRGLLLSCNGLLWVTGDPAVEPAFNMSTGLIRTIRWEREAAESMNFVTLAVSHECERSGLIDAIAKISRWQFFVDNADQKCAEYQLRSDNILYTNRIRKYREANRLLEAKFSTVKNMELIPWHAVGRPVKLYNPEPGILSQLRFDTNPDFSRPLGDSEVDVEIRAVGLNFRDLLTAMGEIAGKTIGLETSGIIIRVGASVTELKPGDRVVYFGTGALVNVLRVDQSLVVKMPDGLPFDCAAGLPVVYATVIHAFYNVSHLMAGETVLIHAAAGGVGQAAIQCAQDIGAEIFATVSSIEKKEFLMTEYGIPDDHIFSSRDLSFAQGIMRMTGNVGVDVCLNSLSGEALHRSWDCIAPFGRFVEIGKKDIVSGGRLDMQPFLPNVSFHAVELMVIAGLRPRLLIELLQQTLNLWSQGKISGAKPLTVLNFSEIEKGLRMLQGGKTMGKIVFVAHANDIVPVAPELPAPYMLESDASYVLAGGLGGIGRPLAEWMGSRGAKSLIFLSRSGQVNPEAEEMLVRLKNKGCEAHIFKCDISDADRVREVIAECQDTLPPIKGCIQSTVILRDRIFERMPYDDWKVSTSPKVQGSWNLHNTLPSDLDFFLMLSSISGIVGYRTQSNYAAGNNYEDALAKYRRSKGLAGSTVNLGIYLHAGYGADHFDYARNLARILGYVPPEGLTPIIEYLIDPRNSLDENTCQLVYGLLPQSEMERNGSALPTFLSYPTYTFLRDTSAMLQNQSANPLSQAYHVPSLLAAAETKGDAVRVVFEAVKRKLTVLLNVPAEQIDPKKSLRDNGVDSLIAMEFRAWVGRDLGAQISLLEMLARGDMMELSESVVGVSKYVKTAHP